MPTRSLVYEALVLRARESPAGDRILTMMTAESGLIDAFVFGGPKSKLRSIASPYSSGRAFVYLDPVKDFRKLTDFDVGESFPGLRDELDRLWAAGLIAELLVKTSGGGGDFPLVLDLTREALRALDRESVDRSDIPITLYLWRLVGLLGLGPDPCACAACGRTLRVFGSERYAAEGARGLPSRVPECVYSSIHEGFLCSSCRTRFERERRADGPSSFHEPDSAGHAPFIPIGPEALKWLSDSETLGFAETLLLPPLGDGERAGLRALTFHLARRAADSPLASFARGTFPT
ncbi:MAG TPA: DNA repair protein RecO C-terminal domain-containing protein [Rectinemataceae bacterium]|nr:DNA repair protein RecO C-terminal domain-containing protein [Rectinemataceae bacterium]